MLDWWASLTQDEKYTIFGLLIVIILSFACGGILLFSILFGGRGGGGLEAVIDAPRTAETGEIIRFSAADSKPGDDAQISEYVWDFGDGRFGSGVTTEYAYTEAGVYTVRLEIITDGNDSASETHQINIGAVQTQDPRAVIVAPDSVMVGQTVTFNGRNSIPGDSAIRNYEWDLGDGTRLNAVTVDHIYDRAGTFSVSLTVEDADGNRDTATRQISVTASIETAPPQTGPVAVMVIPATGAVGQSITFDARNSRAGSNPLQSYRWSFGDGTQADGIVITHIYSSTGAFNVMLTVTDNSGLSDTTTQTIAVGAAAPTNAPDLPTIPPPAVTPFGNP